jgi:hypothetical protein
VTRSRAAALAAYVVATLVMTWPYVNYGRFADASYVGDQQLIIWTLGWDNHALLTGTPLFDSNIYFPAADSLRYNEHLFAVSLFTLPWAALGASPLLAHNIIWFLAFPLNGLAAFALLSRFVTRWISAFIGSLAFTFSFYVMLHAHAHLHLIWLWPLPLSLLLLERWFDRPSPARVGLWTVTVLIALLTSWYVAVMALLANGVALAVFALTARSRPPAGERSRHVWATRVIQLSLVAVVMAICVYPFARHYVGLRASPGEAASFAADIASYVVPPENTVVGQLWRDNINDRPRGLFGEQTLFAGWIALALAAAGTIVLMRGAVPARAWLFPALTVTAVLISLGPSPGFNEGLAPFNWLAALPGGAGMRAPARFAAVAMLGISGLAAIAVDAMVSRWTCAVRLVPLLIPLILVEYFVVGFPAGRPEPQAVPAIYLTPEVQSARALVSVPEYEGTDTWFLGGNYLYYSMMHWRPIVNGFGRTAPEGHAAVVQSLHDFPANPEPLRATGVQYVVMHADRFPNHGEAVLTAARASADYRLVRQVGPDYLFEVVRRGQVR